MSTEEVKSPYNIQPFRSAVFRGLGVVLPPLLTILILLWIGNSIQTFVLSPIETLSRHVLVRFMDRTKEESFPFDNPDVVANPILVESLKQDSEAQLTPPSSSKDELQRLLELLDERLGNSANPVARSRHRQTEPKFDFKNVTYVQLTNGEWIPEHIRNSVEKMTLDVGGPVPIQGNQFYHRYVDKQILRKIVVIPFFLAAFIISMYLLGKFLAAGVGRILWNSMEAVITRLPIIRTVYTSVKQVTDFFVGGESDIDFKRVVAVEYPRKGSWSVGFVTGESMLTIRGACNNEPIVSILMPTSPVPGTGFTISVRKSETIDLDIPIEQALQFVVSCGVVIPDEQMQEKIDAKIAARTAEFDAIEAELKAVE